MIAVSIYVFFAYVITFFFGVFYDQGVFYDIPALNQIENFHYIAIPFIFLGSILIYKKYIYHYVNATKKVIEIKKNTLNIFIFIFLLIAFYGYLNDYNTFRYNNLESTGLLFYSFRLLSYFYVNIIFLIFFGNDYKKNILEIFFYLTPLYLMMGGLSTALDFLVILTLVGINQYREIFLLKKNLKKLINIRFAGVLVLAIPIVIILYVSGVMIKENEVKTDSIMTYFASTWVIERFYPHHVSLKNSLKNHNKYKIKGIKDSFIERKNILINNADKKILLRHDLNEHNNDIIYKQSILLRSGSAPGFFGSIFYLFNNNSVALIIIFCILILLYVMFDRIVKNCESKNFFFISFVVIYLFGRSFLGGPTTFLILLDESILPFSFLIYLTFIRTKFV